MPPPLAFEAHLTFFDEDQDGKISVRETQRGLERLGFGRLLSVPGALGINVSVALLGRLQKRPLEASDLTVTEAGSVRHTDTLFIDDAGRFDEAALEGAFARFGKRFAGEALTIPELVLMLGWRLAHAAGQGAAKLVGLPLGVGAVTVEWAALLWVAGSVREGIPVLERETVRRFYIDARFFHDVAARLAERRAQREGTRTGRLRNLAEAWLI